MVEIVKPNKEDIISQIANLPAEDIIYIKNKLDAIQKMAEVKLLLSDDKTTIEDKIKALYNIFYTECYSCDRD